MPAQVKEFLDTIVIPHFKERVETDVHKEVIEKVLECIRDLAEEMGPASIQDHMDWIITTIEALLDKTATCQKGKGNMENEGPEEDEDDESDEEDDEDLDHDELILGNATDVIISLSKCLGDSFLPYLQRTAPKLVKYLGDDHPKSDKIMVIGALSETFNQCPVAITSYFAEFLQVLFKNANTTDSSLNRNVAYGMAIVSEKAPINMFAPHLASVMQAIKTMHTASEDDDAKDNCTAAIVRILERYHDKMDQAEYETLFNQIMGALPLQGDPSENQTMLKFIMNVNAGQPQRIQPFMNKISLTCLKILTDSRCKQDLDESFKVLTAKFIKNVIMDCGRQDVVDQLGIYESQMSEFEKADLAKYMSLASGGQ